MAAAARGRVTGACDWVTDEHHRPSCEPRHRRVLGYHLVLEPDALSTQASELSGVPTTFETAAVGYRIGVRSAVRTGRGGCGNSRPTARSRRHVAEGATAECRIAGFARDVPRGGVA